MGNLVYVTSNSNRGDVAIAFKGISDELWPNREKCVGRMKHHLIQRVDEWCLSRQHAGTASRKTRINCEKFCKYLKEEPSGATGLGGLGLAECFMDTLYYL